MLVIGWRERESERKKEKESKRKRERKSEKEKERERERERENTLTCVTKHTIKKYQKGVRARDCVVCAHHPNL